VAVAVVLAAGVVVLIRSPLAGGLSGTRSEEFLGAGPVTGMPPQGTGFSQAERGRTDAASPPP
jgi:hypothetical protein